MAPPRAERLLCAPTCPAVARDLGCRLQCQAPRDWPLFASGTRRHAARPPARAATARQLAYTVAETGIPGASAAIVFADDGNAASSASDAMRKTAAHTTLRERRTVLLHRLLSRLRARRAQRRSARQDRYWRDRDRNAEEAARLEPWTKAPGGEGLGGVGGDGGSGG